MHFGLISLLPEIFDALDHGVIGRAFKTNLASRTCWNPRDFTTDVHRTVDDKPYGGGPGMLMKYEPLHAAIKTAKATLPQAPVIYLSPQGKPFKQATAKTALQHNNLILVCGRYEGIDERIIQQDIDEEWSLGDFVLSGGEIPAMAIIDAITRLLPGTLGHNESAGQDSFQAGLLDFPQYTRPEEIDGLRTPSVLLSGDHAAIQHYREEQALINTWQKRPDLVKRAILTQAQKELLDKRNWT